MAKTYLTPEEIQRIEDYAKTLRDKLLIRILFHLGCRVSEALALKIGNVDIINKTVTINHLKAKLKITCPDCGGRLNRSSRYCHSCGNKVEEIVTKTIENRRMRILPIDEVTINILKKYIDDVLTSSDDSTRLFLINRHRAWQIIRDCSNRAGLPKLINPESGKTHNVSPHKLRDAFAVHAVKLDDSGDGLRMLQEHLGHQSFNTTAKYRKISGEEHKNWFDKLWDKQQD